MSDLTELEQGANRKVSRCGLEKPFERPESRVRWKNSISTAGVRHLRALATVLDRRGQTAESAQHYAAFVAAWANADPLLQRHVAAARTRLSELKAK